MSGLPGVQLEHQQVLAIESELDGREIRKRPHEQAGGDQESSVMAICATIRRRLRLSRGTAAARSPVRDFLQRRHDVRARRLHRRSKPEQHARQQRKRGRDAQHVPVQFRAQGEVLAAIRQQQRQETDSPDGEHHAQSAAERREQDALGEELADDPKPSGAQTQPQRDFAAPRGGARQEEVGDIGARDARIRPTSVIRI